jgi:glycerol uptake facilitator-like aquaporin
LLSAEHGRPVATGCPVVDIQLARQLWLFIIAPLIGAGAAGFLFKEARSLT